jgi:hypothetical protein
VLEWSINLISNPKPRRESLIDETVYIFQYVVQIQIEME